MAIGPQYNELTTATAHAYAEWLAEWIGSAIAGEPVLEMGDESPIYVFPLANGRTADVWLECGQVYGEA